MLAERHSLTPMTEDVGRGVSLSEAAGLLMEIMHDCRDLFREVKGGLDGIEKGEKAGSNLDISRLLKGTGRRSYPKVERFHKEVKLDDVRGVSELVSMMKRAGGKGK